MENTNVKTVGFVSELTKFVMALLTVPTMKRMNGHVSLNLPNALDQQKFVMAMRMKTIVASNVS